METSYFLAQVMGLSLALFALMGIIYPARIQMMIEQYDPRSLLSLILGAVGVVIGLSLVLSHNIWDGSWRVLVTLFGWIALIKGVSYLYMPQVILLVGRRMAESTNLLRLMLLVALVVGAYLALKGFGY